MAEIRIYSDVSYSQPYVRFLRVNDVAPVQTGPNQVIKTMDNKFRVSVNPRADVRMFVYNLADGSLKYSTNATGAVQRIHVLTIPANTLDANTEYLVSVEQQGAGNVLNTAEIEIKTGP